MSSVIISRSQLLTGRIISGLVILFMLFDAVIKFVKPSAVVETTVSELGYSEHHIFLHGILALSATLLYAIPKTAFLGAILLTAYLGGAVASHLRVDNPIFSHTLFPVYIGVFMWIGLWLREIKVRSLLPLNESL
jgi:hypothetical protein